MLLSELVRVGAAWSTRVPEGGSKIIEGREAREGSAFGTHHLFTDKRRPHAHERITRHAARAAKTTPT
jgi:hypothetical protein